MASSTMKRGRSSRQRQSTPYPPASVALPAQVHPTGTWAADEHDRFLEAMRLYPKGPWKAIADHVETRSVRQVQTHAQKYQEKVVRRMRGLRKPKRKGDESDEDIGHRVVMGTYGKLRKRRKGNDNDPLAEIEPQASPSMAASASPTAASQTDKESGSESDSSYDSDTESSAKVAPRRQNVTICVSTSPPSTQVQSGKTNPSTKQSFSALLEEQSPVGPDCIVLAPLRLSELSPGWFYLDELNLCDKSINMVDEKESALEGPSGLPSLGESLDFFIEYLSVAIQ